MLRTFNQGSIGSVNVDVQTEENEMSGRREDRLRSKADHRSRVDCSWMTQTRFFGLSVQRKAR